MVIGYTINQVLNDEKGDPKWSLNRRICKGQSDAIQNALQWRKFSSKALLHWVGNNKSRMYTSKPPYSLGKHT